VRRIFGTALDEYLPALGLLVFTTLYLIVAYRYKPLVRAFPAGVAWFMLAILALDLLSRTETRFGRAVARWLNPSATAGRREGNPVPAILWLAGLALLLVLIGIYAAVPIFVFASLRWRGRRGYGMCLLTAGAATAFIWLMFSVLLRLSLYPGMLVGNS
jgi:hypothetical protein